MNQEYIPQLIATGQVRTARILRLDPHGAPLVETRSGGAAAALVLGQVPAADLREAHLAGAPVLVVDTADGPVVLGVALARPRPTEPVRLSLDGQRLELSAGQEVVLRCGEASITLTRAGKAIIRGAYVLTHAAGVNKIKGGSVQIN